MNLTLSPTVLYLIKKKKKEENPFPSLFHTYYTQGIEPDKVTVKMNQTMALAQ